MQQLRGLLLAHVRTVPFPEQRPRQHLPKACRDKFAYVHLPPGGCLAMAAGLTAVLPGSIDKSTRASAISLGTPNQWLPPLAPRSTAQKTQIGNLASTGIHMAQGEALLHCTTRSEPPVAMCSSANCTPSMPTVPRKGLPSWTPPITIEFHNGSILPCTAKPTSEPTQVRQAGKWRHRGVLLSPSAAGTQISCNHGQWQPRVSGI